MIEFWMTLDCSNPYCGAKFKIYTDEKICEYCGTEREDLELEVEDAKCE